MWARNTRIWGLDVVMLEELFCCQGMTVCCCQVIELAVCDVFKHVEDMRGQREIVVAWHDHLLLSNIISHHPIPSDII